MRREGELGGGEDVPCDRFAVQGDVGPVAVADGQVELRLGERQDCLDPREIGGGLGASRGVRENLRHGPAGREESHLADGRLAVVGPRTAPGQGQEGE